MRTLPYSDKIRTAAINGFGGIVAKHRAKDGELILLENMTGEKYPMLKSLARASKIVSDNYTIYESALVLGALCFTDSRGKLTLGDKSIDIGDASKQHLIVLGSTAMLYPLGRGIKVEYEYYIYDGADSRMRAVEPAFNLNEVLDVAGVGDSLPSSLEDGELYCLNNGTVYKYTKAGSAGTFSEYCTLTGSDLTAYEGKKLCRVRKYELAYAERWRTVSSTKFRISYTSESLGAGTRREYCKVYYDGSSAGTLLSSNFKSKYNVGDFLRFRFAGSVDGAYRLEKGAYIAKYEDDVMYLRDEKNDEYEKGEISDPGWNISYDGSKTGAGNVYAARAIPHFDCVCTHANRVWGAAGSVIYASKPGELDEFTSYTLSASSAWAVDTKKGGFVACAEYGSSVVFFRENEILRVYGDTPDEFRYECIECAGVRSDSAQSVACVGGYIYYNSKRGVMRYGGGHPVCISEEAGLELASTTGGADDRYYYIARRGEAQKMIYVYDTYYGMWHARETDSSYVPFTRIGNATIAANEILSGNVDTALLDTRGFSLTLASARVARAVFADIYEGTLLRKAYDRIRLRAKVGSGSLKVFIAYDGGERKKLLEISSSDDAGTRMRQADIIPSRCDSFSLSLEADGDVTVYALEREYYIGSENG